MPPFVVAKTVVLYYTCVVSISRPFRNSLAQKYYSQLAAH